MEGTVGEGQLQQSCYSQLKPQRLKKTTSHSYPRTFHTRKPHRLQCYTPPLPCGSGDNKYSKPYSSTNGIVVTDHEASTLQKYKTSSRLTVSSELSADSEWYCSVESSESSWFSYDDLDPTGFDSPPCQLSEIELQAFDKLSKESIAMAPTAPTELEDALEIFESPDTYFEKQFRENQPDMPEAINTLQPVCKPSPDTINIDLLLDALAELIPISSSPQITEKLYCEEVNTGFDSGFNPQYLMPGIPVTNSGDATPYKVFQDANPAVEVVYNANYASDSAFCTVVDGNGAIWGQHGEQWSDTDIFEKSAKEGTRSHTSNTSLRNVQTRTCDSTYIASDIYHSSSAADDESFTYDQSVKQSLNCIPNVDSNHTALNELPDFLYIKIEEMKEVLENNYYVRSKIRPPLSCVPTLINGGGFVEYVTDSLGYIVTLGEGFYGTVFLGRIIYTQQLVAIKFITTKQSKIYDVIKEASVLQLLSEKCRESVPHFYGIAPIKTNPLYHNLVIVTEFVGDVMSHEVHDLTSLISNEFQRVYYGAERLVTDSDWVEFLCELLKTVDKIHQAGILINDLKTNNILLRPHHSKWQLVIIDFGLATVKNEKVNIYVPSEAKEEFLAEFTQTAPEVVYDNCVTTAKSDIYSLGRIVQELSNVFRLQLDDIFAMCLELEPKDRPSCDALIQILNRRQSIMRT